MISQANQSFQTGLAGYDFLFIEKAPWMLTLIQEETAPPPVVKKPNPQNEKNQATLRELEEEVRRYAQYLGICTGRMLTQ